MSRRLPKTSLIRPEANGRVKPTNLFRGEDTIVDVVFNPYRWGRWLKGRKLENVEL